MNEASLFHRRIFKCYRQIGSIGYTALADQIVLQRRNSEAKRHHDELSVNDPDAYYQVYFHLSFLFFL